MYKPDQSKSFYEINMLGFKRNPEAVTKPDVVNNDEDYEAYRAKAERKIKQAIEFKEHKKLMQAQNLKYSKGCLPTYLVNLPEKYWGKIYITNGSGA